jgi:hypothetical protein
LFDLDAAKNVGDAAQAKDANTRLTGMTIGEAKLILGLEDQKQVTQEQILQVFFFLTRNMRNYFKSMNLVKEDRFICRVKYTGPRSVWNWT